MSTDRARSLTRRIGRWHDFYEGLVKELRTTDGLYSFEVDIDSVRERDADGGGPFIADPLITTFRLVGVESLRFDGALFAGLRDDPEIVGWSISEIERVAVSSVGPDLRFELVWGEWDRRLDVQCVNIEMIEPD